MKSVFNRAGYLLADDRASGGKVDEADMLGCSHCQALMKRHLWSDDGGFCHGCDAPVCGPCCDKIPTHGCAPFMRQLERAVNDAYRREQNAKILGF